MAVPLSRWSEDIRPGGVFFTPKSYEGCFGEDGARSLLEDWAEDLAMLGMRALVRSGKNSIWVSVLVIAGEKEWELSDINIEPFKLDPSQDFLQVFQRMQEHIQESIEGRIDDIHDLFKDRDDDIDVYVAKICLCTA